MSALKAAWTIVTSVLPKRVAILCDDHPLAVCICVVVNEEVGERALRRSYHADVLWHNNVVLADVDKLRMVKGRWCVDSELPDHSS